MCFWETLWNPQPLLEYTHFDRCFGTFYEAFQRITLSGAWDFVCSTEENRQKGSLSTSYSSVKVIVNMPMPN
jgi:hypothetical protein